LVVRAAKRFVDAFNSRDWDTAAGMYTDDHELIDHRKLRSMNDGRGPDATMQILQGIAEISADVVWHEDLLMVLGDRHRLVRWWTKGTDERGAPWETGGIAVSVVDERGLFERFEAYDLDDEAAARARFIELAGPHAVTLGPLAEPSPAVEAYRAWVERHNAHDIDGLAALYAHDYTLEDCRPMVRHTTDRAEQIEALRSSFDTVGDLAVDVVIHAATDRFCVGRATWVGSQGSFEIVLDFVAEFDAHGRAIADYAYDPGDPAAWEHYLASTAEPDVPHAERIQREYVAAVNARDWEKLDQLWAEDLVQVDLRMMATEVGQGRDAARATVRSAVETAPDLVLTSRTLAASEDVIAAVLTFSGTTPDGGPAEFQVGYLGVLRDGMPYYNEYLEPDDEQAILARYESWDAHRRQSRQFTELINAREWDRLRTCYDDDFSQTDYRELGASAIVGGRAFVDHLEETFAPVPDLQATLDVLAVDGNRRVGRITYHGTNDEIQGAEFEVVFWTVTTIDDDLRLLQSDLYGSEEDARTALAGASETNLAARHFEQRSAAFNARDWELMATLYNEHAAYEDRRAAMRHEQHGGRDAMVEMWRSIARNEGALMRHEVVATDGPRRAIARYLVSASYRGGPYEVVIVEGVVTDESGRGWRGLVADDAPDDELRELLRSWRPEAQPA
jgi:ketosteroid isomerase-like protein